MKNVEVTSEHKDVERCVDMTEAVSAHRLLLTERRERRVLPHRINSQPGADENQSKHHKQNVAQSLALGVVGHFSSLRIQTFFNDYIITMDI